MSMRTWTRKMAHEKAERAKIKKLNKPRYYQGKKQPSLFALNWRKFAIMPIAKPGRSR